MSVPVRYSAAAEYAVDESGLSNTLTQEEQYHLQQQQHHQQQQQELYCQLLSPPQHNNVNNNNSLMTEQQQLMQQQPSMSSRFQPAMAAYINENNAASNSMDQNNHNQFHATSSDLDVKPTTSARAAAAAACLMSDEGRFGTPGAASLEYRQYELQQQQQQQTSTGNNNNNDQPMEPSLMDNENNTNNNLKNLEDKLNAMSSDELYNKLKEYNVLQDKYHTVLLLPKVSKREVTAGGRDGSAYVLRCLKMWYEQPSDVLFSAMSLVDRFLDRMAVKPKHMACMSVASFHLAIKQLDLKPIPAEDLVTISQCGCTAGDLERMAGVVANKLGVQMGHAPITSVSYLRIYYALFRNMAKEIGGHFFEFYQQLIKLEELENRLEILVCDVKTTVIAPSTLALVLICLHLDFHIKESYTTGSPELKHVFDYILFLQEFMRIPDRLFTSGFSIVSGILSHYNGQNKQPYKQRLVWKLSSRTLRLLRPINRFSSDLPTIKEYMPNALADDDGCRSRTESISSEEEEDWPTSPIFPIFEQC